jgi:type VI secretion system secreted protein VgrG
MTRPNLAEPISARESGEPTGPPPFTFQLASRPAEEFSVRAFSGREEISNDYRFLLTLACATEPAGHLLDQHASLEIRAGAEASRHVHGVVAGVGYHDAGRRGAHHLVELVLVPRFHLLRHRRNSRVFQDLSVPQIIDVVLELHGVRRRWALLRPYPERAYCVQHRETDHAFVTRLCAEEGIFFHFEHGESGPETIVLADDVGLSPSIQGLPNLAYRPADGQGGLMVHEDHVFRFAAERTIAPTAALVHEYDFERPRLHLVSRNTTTPAQGGFDDPRYEHYEHHGDYEKVDVEHDVARLRLEQLRRESYVATGETACRRLLPGHRFTLGEHPVDACNRGWLVTAVDHRGTAATEDEPTYACRLRAAPDDVQPRPPVAVRSMHQVVEPATVTGPPGEDIHTDHYGRIKVRFHWDRNGPLDDHSSCWIRHAEPWAGASYGTMQLPRVGMEVVVTFLGGDCDRPLVIGCVNNATHLPPFALPDEKTKSGIKTRSTPHGVGYNELSFDDASGQEQVLLRAERDLNVGVGRDRCVAVGNDSTFAVAAREHHRAGSRQTQILGEDRLEIAGDRRVELAGHSHAAIGGDRHIRVEGLDHTIFAGPILSRC